MNRIGFVLLACTLGSCANAPIAVYNHPQRINVTVDGKEVAVAPGDKPGQYSALESGAPFIRLAPQLAAQQELLVRGIEKATGCKVTTAVMVPDTVMINAVVKC